MKVPLIHSEKRDEHVFYIFIPHHRMAARIARGALDAAGQAHCPWIIESIHDAFSYHTADPGLLGALCLSWNDGMIERCQNALYPVINLANSSGPVKGMGNYLSDDEAVGRMAARHLLKQGFRHFLSVYYPDRVAHEERARGFREIIRAEGLPLHELRQDYSSVAAGKNRSEFITAMGEQFRPAIEKLPLGSGIFTTSDTSAFFLLRFMNLYYPEHLDTTGVLGVDNEIGSHAYPGMIPGLSSVDPGFYQAGYAAMQWLMAHPGREGKKQVENELRRFPPVGVEARASTACGGCADPMTARMIRWAWDRIHGGDAVSVSLMARAHRASMKTVERRFSRFAGETASGTIARLRLDLARHLLRHSPMPIAEVSAQCGYAKPDVLSRAIKSAEGLSPREFRNQPEAEGRQTRLR